MNRTLTKAALLLALAVGACGGAATNGYENGIPIRTLRIDADRMLADLRFLSSDELAGRMTGTPGNERAREHIRAAFLRHGLEPLGDSFTHDFSFTGRRDGAEYHGVNVVGRIRGTRFPDRHIVVTAHYDHVGIGQPDERGDSIYNGADDNASGTAALLTLAGYFRANPPAHSIVFAALDAEEMGLQGARAFVADPPIPLESVLLNVNMDMISRNERDELYAAGTHHYPFLRTYVERVAARAPLSLRMGHDRPDLPRGDDWTSASDHGAFHAQGVPFLYFGVEDHPDYHRPSDEYENIDPDFYTRAARTVLGVILEVDRDPAPILEAREVSEP